MTDKQLQELAQRIASFAYRELPGTDGLDPQVAMRAAEAIAVELCGPVFRTRARRIR